MLLSCQLLQSVSHMCSATNHAQHAGGEDNRVQGERPWSIQATTEEVAAWELMTLDGLGEAAAMALSLTTSLGGQRHPSLSSLKSGLRQALST